MTGSSSSEIIDCVAEIRCRVFFIFPDGHQQLPMFSVGEWNVGAIDNIPEGTEALVFESYLHIRTELQTFGTQLVDSKPFSRSGAYSVWWERPEEMLGREFLAVHPALEDRVWVTRWCEVPPSAS
ncbi:hypothetical protein K2Q08_01190 [Patescibacteria group bacterium]|nr:hypothetical protein [Patescibacteria group bacterium]